MSEIKQALMPFAAFAEHAIENVNGTWVWKNNTQNERICDWFGPSDFGAALSSAPIAEREPAYWAVHSKTGMDIGLWPHKSDADEALRGYEGGTITPLHLDPPPTSELEAENARLREALARIEARTRKHDDDTPGDDKRDKMHAYEIARRVREGGKVDG